MQSLSERELRQSRLGCRLDDQKLPSPAAMGRRLSGLLLVGMAFYAITGCGGSSSGSKSFTLQVLPSSVAVVAGGSPQILVVSAAPVNGFNGTVSVALSTLPSGVTASPSTLSLNAGAIGQISLTASTSAVAGQATITLTGTSGAVSQTATSALTVAAHAVSVNSASLSATTFDFGNNLVSNALTKTVAVVTNTGTETLTMAPALSGDASYSIVAAQSCGATLAPSATCDMVLAYNPTAPSAPSSQDAVLNMNFANVSASTPQTVAITGTSAALPKGTVTATDNPQVALYSMTLPFPGSMTVKFGQTTSYGLTTWAQSTDTAGGPVSIFVAGMKPSTAYHMAATVEFSNGITVTDSYHTFTTGAFPNIPNLSLSVTTSNSAGKTPNRVWSS